MSEIEFDPLQLEAIQVACDPSNRFVAITGAAGTGKTSILEKTYKLIKDAGYSIALCSPTGKAAKRIFEVTGIDACTIHRLLEYTHPGEKDEKGNIIGFSYPRRTRENPLEFDVILADEYAMVNKDLHRNLVDAVKPGGRIIVYGDDNQLAPIEDGGWNKDKDAIKEPSEFVKALRNPKIPSVTLKTVFRQGKDSGILANLQDILRAKLPSQNPQWTHKFTDQPVQALTNYILDNYFDDEVADEDKIDFSKTNNQIIVPQNTTWVGTTKLNYMIQALYHESHEDYIIIPRHNWDYGMNEVKGSEGGSIKLHIGDKVIYKQNNLDLQVFNGETGIVIEYDKEFGSVVIDFGDREQSIPPHQIKINMYGKSVEFDPRKDIDLAYAITTHKSQGSQYENVVYIMNKSNTYMLSNRNIYTATSRAKKHVYIISDQVSLTRAVYRRD